MPQKTNLNVAPYNDDFDPSNNFYKVLFRSGYSIQGRELTSLQSILQNQIENFGKFQFKQGQQVIPGEVGLNTRLDYVKLSSVSEVAINVNGDIIFQKYDIKQLVGSELRGLNSGVIAKVVETSYATSNSSDTIFVNYINSGDENNESTFRQGETLEVVGGVNTPLLVVGVDGSSLPTSINVIDPLNGNVFSLQSPAMGFASAVEVEEGVYFVNGYFVRNEKQIVVVDNYYDKPSAQVGFDIVEEIVTPEQDSSLYDNARGYSNATAPGAHRLKIELTLKKYGYFDKTDNNFIRLIQVNNGAIEKEVKPADYTLLESTLARRTYDESGDYVVDNFNFGVREFYQKDGNNGLYQFNTQTNLVNGISEDEASSKMVLNVGPGKAYVKGYEIVNKETKEITIDKARDSISRNNVTIKSPGLSEYKITNVYGSIPLNTVGDELTGYPTVYLNSVFNDGTIGLNGLESTGYSKKTVDRRSKSWGLDVGIKTIYVQIAGPLPVSDSEYPDLLWYVKTFDGTEVTSADSVEVIAHSLVRRDEVSDSESQFFAELTIVGDRSVLDTKFLEYGEDQVGNKRYLYLTESAAVSNDTGEKWGFVVDYNETTTPVIGLSKPKDFKLLERGVGFNQDIDKVISKGRTPDGETPYSSTFGFSYFNPVFFTRLKLEQPVSLGFTKGKYITGRQSKAYGVIESDTTGNYSSQEVLFVSTISGEFIPGESILDEDGNSLKIASENTISHFVVTFSGFGYPSNAKAIINGQEIDQSIIDVKEYGGQVYKVKIIDRNRFTSTFSSPPLVQLTNGPTEISSQTRITAVLNKNTVYTFKPENVKSLNSIYNNYKFTADVDLLNTKYSTYSQVSNFTFFGYNGKKYLECNGFGVDLSKDLVKGDIIQFTDVDNNILKMVVQSVTDPEGTSRSRIYLDYSLPNTVTNAAVIKIRPVIDNTSSSTLVFPTGSKQISSLIDSDSDTKFKYYTRKDFITDLSASGGLLTFSAQLPVGTQRFVEFNENNFIITVLDKGSSTVVENGDILYINSKNISINQSTVNANQVTAGSVVLTLPGNYFGSSLTTYPKLKLTATVEVDKARPRLKTAVKNKRVIVIPSGDKVIPLRGQDYDSENIETLSYSDVYKLRYVYEGTTTNPPTVDSSGTLVSGTDITYKFNFDNGQRDTYYDVSRIVLNPGFDSPTGQLVIAFDYFNHSQGDFCTVDSYLHEAGVPSEEIPFFNSSVYGLLSLRDVIDFRPKVDSSTIVTGFQDVSILSNPEGTEYVNFVGEGGVVCATPASEKELEYTAIFSESQYLDRIDALFLTKKGDFIVKQGNSSLNPSKPDPIDDAITLAYLHIPAYTNTTKDVRIVSVDNKRYTMRDIGKLEKRIERLEYYTSLSILEQQALNMQIKDALGLERFKSGFIVDNFEAHGIGNISSVDYKCGIDTQQSVLRPQSKEDSIKLKEFNTREDQRAISGYVVNNGVVTLPYTPVRLLGNDNATNTINPNPFVVIQYVGDVKITPTIDQWYDTTIAPLVVDSNTKLNSIFLSKDNVREAFSSIFNNYIINWVGSNQSIFGIESLANINSEDITSTVSVAKVSSSSNVSPQNNDLAKGVSTKTVNENSVSTALQFFIRSIPIKFKVTRLKPKTQVFVFMEGKNVNRWVNPDSKFTGVAGNSLTTFGSNLITDDNGNLSGIILVPSGKAPEENSRWTGDVNTMSFDPFSEEIKFTEGAKTIRFTSSSSDATKDNLDTYAEVTYHASGILPQNPVSITSTAISYFKANEGVQLVNSNTDVETKPNPLAQTFKVEGIDGGVFVTDIDLFFAKKSNTIPLRVYLTNVDSGKPGKNIVPGTQVSLNPETKLKVYLTGDLESISVTKGELITGKNSGCIGPISKIYDRNNVLIGDENTTSYQLNKDQVYTFVLSNHNGKKFSTNEELVIPSVTRYNALNNKSAAFFIAKDSGKVVDLVVENFGDNYTSATIVIESPQLPGGSTAVGSVDVSDGKIYNSSLNLNGSGYTESPSIIVRGIGSGSGGAVIKSVIEIDTPAVVMGIADDSISVSRAITPTKFVFDYPVYLQNNSEYAITVETDSIDYEIWSSTLGQTEITNGSVVNTQPLLGSLYKSQNTDNWTEDIFQDIKFNLYRAEFDISRPAELITVNDNLGYELIDSNPFETSVRSSTTATSPLFKNNNSIIKVNHRDHGFEDRGNSYVFFKRCDDVGGISKVSLNTLLFKVANSGIDSYNVTGPNRAGSNIIGGGTNVLATYNRKYEKLYLQVPFLQLEGTSLETFVKTTNIIPVDSNTQNYLSYSSEDYEKTFLNEEHFFLNQKVVASRVNELYNSLDNSLSYKFVLKSDNSKLSPVIDLNTCSVKTVNNRIENATGYENRYGKRSQILTFLPIYNLQLSIVGDENAIQPNISFTGNASGAIGTVISYADNTALIKVRTSSQFIQGETLTLKSEAGTQLTNLNVTIITISEQTFNFTENANIVAYYPQNLNVDYTNIINGRTRLWDSKTRQLIVDNSYSPINNDYTSVITLGSPFARNSNPSLQSQDIFRVGDVVKSVDNKFIEIAKMEFTTGVDYIPDTDARNSSSVAKYVTKEIAINNPGTSIDVRVTANVLSVDNIKVFYKIKKSSDQKNFDDVNWSPFNVDGNPDVDTLAVPGNSISASFEKQSYYQEFKYSVNDLPEFTSFSIKVVMKGDNPAFPPKVQDLRGVASY